MIENKKVLAIIPARGGSKSIPKKNIVQFNGKPLIAWTIETALKTNEIDKVIVSTDCSEIANVSTKHGAEVQIRPSKLASDDALVIETIKYVLEELKKSNEQFDYIVLLEATSPLRLPEDVSKCIQKIEIDKLDSIATYKEADLNPHRAWKIEDGIPNTFIEGVIPWLPRQKLPKAYQLNGAVYVVKVKELMQSSRELVLGKKGAIIMPKERSVDIDDSIDFIIAETIMKKNEERGNFL
ncbi:acylneuraminate cytidylyltransferase family protein [Psychrobacillus sp. FSL H8-0483]|uniref:acylneuraminate cytidylyltransferase family protein n=1 Tax=Psychrobacillus sp. FSL H8-0483 TaxID=2921389 RepID=UPI00315ACA05